jgi:hypothetical protein
LAWSNHTAGRSAQNGRSRMATLVTSVGCKLFATTILRRSHNVGVDVKCFQTVVNFKIARKKLSELSFHASKKRQHFSKGCIPILFIVKWLIVREDSIDFSRRESFRSHICKDHSSYNYSYIVLYFFHSPTRTFRIDAIMIPFMTEPVQTQAPDSRLPALTHTHIHAHAHPKTNTNFCNSSAFAVCISTFSKLGKILCNDM